MIDFLTFEYIKMDGLPFMCLVLIAGIGVFSLVKQQELIKINQSKLNQKRVAAKLRSDQLLSGFAR